MERINEQTDYEKIKGDLRVRLIYRKRNEEIVRASVSRDVGCGYSLVVYLRLPEREGRAAVANFPKLLADLPENGGRAVFEDALTGSSVKDPPVLRPILDILGGGKPRNILESGELTGDSPLYVLTTERGVLGASALYYPGLAKEIGSIVGGSYYILPSSVHEVLILPDDGRMEPREMAQMVRDVNRMEVKPDERLGDRVLHYRADLDRLKVACDLDRERKKERERE